MSLANSQFNDDEYNYDPTAQKPSIPTEKVLLPGVYRFEASLIERTKEGEPVVSEDRSGNEWPIYVMPSVSVTEPMDAQQSVTVWHEVATRPYRYNDNEPFKSDGAILLAGVDKNLALNATTFGEAANELKNLCGSRISFIASTGLEATDTAWAKAEIERLGLAKDDYAARRKIYNQAKVRTKNFTAQKATKLTPAKYNLTIKSPLSGNMITAKTVIKTILPSDTDGVELGTGKFPPRNF
jgi:hypothetical protein